jgi:3-hydroxybutyryl-CoA dehydrogenase
MASKHYNVERGMKVEAITVVGAAAQGRTIAKLAARAGFRTILEDITGQMPMAELKGEPIKLCTSIEDSVRDADMVIEAVPEDMETKLEIFTVLDKSARPDAILVSTTSVLSLTELASITLRAERMVGMHFYDDLIEVVRGLDTGSEALEAAEAVARRMWINVIVIRESPGSVINRLCALQANEAFALVREGVATPEAIDKAMSLAGGSASGPFEWADRVGLDNLLQELERLEKAHGERYRPNPLLTQYVRAGRTGKRAGRGVYRY